jgi:hypothetical protein
VARQSTRRLRAEFAAEPRSPQLTRHLLRDTLHGWQLQHLDDVALLLVSELATNAVLHARSGFRLDIEQRDEVIRVSVYDCSAAGPARRHSGPDAGTGRGIGLVEVLASAWGTARDVAPWTKVVWFELPTAPGALPRPPDGAVLTC